MAANSPTDIVNLALVRIGYKHRLGNIYDGSRASSVALDIYSQTRDEMLREGTWDFAKRDVSLTLLKQGLKDWTGVSWSTQYPPIPWRFEYAYPADCLRARSIKRQPLFTPDVDPRPAVWTVDSDGDSKGDGSNVPTKVILCNVENAVLCYTTRVTDPLLMEADFIEALAAALGRRLAPILVGADGAKMATGDEAQSGAVADATRG